jgi:hypothetical protein
MSDLTMTPETTPLLEKLEEMKDMARQAKEGTAIFAVVIEESIKEYGIAVIGGCSNLLGDVFHAIEQFPQLAEEFHREYQIRYSPTTTHKN